MTESTIQPPRCHRSADGRPSATFGRLLVVRYARTGRHDPAAPPDGEDPGWRGCRLGSATLYLPESLAQNGGPVSLSLTAASIGSDGISGTATASWTAGYDESIYLEQLEHQVKRGRCPADTIIDNWLGAYDRDIARLIDGSAYRNAA